MSENTAGESVWNMLFALPDIFDHAGAWCVRHRIELLDGISGILLSLLLFILLLVALRRIAVKVIAIRFVSAADVVDRLSVPLSLLVLISGISGSVDLIHFPGKINELADKTLFSIFIFVFIGGIFRIIDFTNDILVKKFRRKKAEFFLMNKLLIELCGRITKVLVWTTATVLVLRRLFALNIVPVLTGAGVLGVAVAFAAQNTIANLFGAFSILGSRLFKVGDWVKSGSDEGIVEQIGFRSVRLRAFDGRLIDIPNRVIADNKLENFSSRHFWREEFVFGLVYQTPPEKISEACRIITGVAAELSARQFPGRNARFAFVKYGDSALVIRGFVWFKTDDWYELQELKEEFNIQILRRFNESGISFAYPTQTVFVQQITDEKVI